jgi:GT2 family glycosyltransferase
VVIATRDRPARLSACLEALAGQTFDRFRVIVVDDGGSVPITWGAAKIVRNESSLGPGPSRNRGVEAGDSPLLVFLDDDVRAHAELLARHHAALAGGSEPLVSIGALLPPETGRVPLWDLWQADRLAREHERLSRGEASPSWTHLYTGNVALRRADFEAVGGFDAAFARQEDMELGFRLAEHGCRFAFEPRAVVWHDADHSLADWLLIPAASARYDVLFDRLRPESGRLRTVRADLARRHWALRAARRLLRSAKARQRAERLAIALARGMRGVHALRPALAAFSLVWDLEYDRALAEATATAEERRPPEGRSRP